VRVEWSHDGRLLVTMTEQGEPDSFKP